MLIEADWDHDGSIISKEQYTYNAQGQLTLVVSTAGTTVWEDAYSYECP